MGRGARESGERKRARAYQWKAGRVANGQAVSGRTNSRPSLTLLGDQRKRGRRDIKHVYILPFFKTISEFAAR